MAPDASAAAAGRKLAKPAPWKALGANERALWGECQGSAVYQTRVAVADFSTKCSCPSRKFPCKHALGLLFLAAEAPSSFRTGAEPEWVASWFEKRDAAQQKKQARAEQPQKPVDAAAQAKRASKRHATVVAGLDHLDTWLADLVRRGLGHLQGEGPALFDAEARRLVDAQAPGVAARLRDIGGLVGAGDAWVSRVLDEMGRLALLGHAYRRIEALPALLAHDVRRRVGFTLEHAEVVAHGDVVEDEWIVAGTVTDEEERVRSQRSWLVGQASGRRALVLQFAAGTARFADVFLPGSALRAKLGFWPASAPERALVVERLGEARTGNVPPHASDIATALAEHAAALARDPWLGPSLFLLDGVAVAAGDAVHVVDRRGLALRLRAAHDVLWALSGGHPLLLAAEWDGFELSPLAAFSEGRTVPLAKGAAA